MPKLNPYALLLPFVITMAVCWVGCRETLQKGKERPVVDSLEAKISLIRSSNPDEAVELAHQGLESSIKKKLPHYQIEFLGLIGSLFSNEGRMQEGIEYFDEGIALAIDQKDSLNQAKLMSKRGYAYLQNNQQDEAMKDITTSILLLNKVKRADDTEKQSLLFNANLDLVSLYAGRLEYEKALVYADTCELLLESGQNPINEARFLYELAWLQLNKGSEKSEIESLQKSIRNYREGSAIFIANGYEYMTQSVNLFISDAFEIWRGIILDENEGIKNQLSLNLQDSSDQYLDKHISYLRATNSLQNLASALQTQSQKKLELTKYLQAKNLIFESLKIAGELNSRKDSALGYWLMAEVYEKTGQLDSSIWYLQQYDIINYNVRRIASEEALKFAEAGFQTEKKELENQKIRLQSRQRLQGTISIAKAIGLLLISIAFYYYISNINKKKLMAKQREINQRLVIDLMKEQTIESLNSRLQGQEKERKRIAQELHDTLGGTLAALKLSMEGLKKNLDEETKEKFKHSQELLKMAYQETRQLSHEMMALPLKHLGLEPSIKSLCETINRSGKIKVDYKVELRTSLELSNEEGTHVYRILQELLQNVIKHARANQVRVYLKNSEAGLKMSVKDNGRGFPEKINKKTQGMGLSNIEDRVKGLRGKLRIHSVPGKGSEVLIFLPA